MYLITGGAATNRGQVKFYPYVSAMLKGWGWGEHNYFWVFFTQELEVLAILKGGRGEKVSTL